MLEQVTLFLVHLKSKYYHLGLSPVHNPKSHTVLPIVPQPRVNGGSNYSIAGNRWNRNRVWRPIPDSDSEPENRWNRESTFGIDPSLIRTLINGDKK